MKELIVTISKDGSKIVSEAIGFQGQECNQVTAPLLQALGQNFNSTDKPEATAGSGSGIRVGN